MAATTEQLCAMTCKPCEGGVETMSNEDAHVQLKELPGWSLVDGGQAIERTWSHKDFVACIERMPTICEIAEAEGHHPDIHIESYRKLRIRMTTHAIGGLSENDFIVAAKLDHALL